MKFDVKKIFVASMLGASALFAVKEPKNLYQGPARSLRIIERKIGKMTEFINQHDPLRVPAIKEAQYCYESFGYSCLYCKKHRSEKHLMDAIKAAYGLAENHQAYVSRSKS